LLEPKDYLNYPTARSSSIVLSKNKRFFSHIRTLLEENEKDINSVVFRSSGFEKYSFDLITRRKLYKTKLDGFTLILHGYK